MIVIDADIEKRAAIVGPHHAAAGVGNLVGDVAARGQIPDPDGVEFRALVVDRVGEKFMVGAVRGAAQVPVGLALGLGVAVENDAVLLGAAAAWPASQLGILAAFDVARIVLERPVGRRHGAVVLLEPRLHFVEQRLLQRLRRRERPLSVGVFRLQIGADFQIELCRVAHHVLPVFGAQPAVVVGQGHAVMGNRSWPACGGWGRGRESGRLSVRGHVGPFRRRIRVRAGAALRGGGAATERWHSDQCRRWRAGLVAG